MHLIRVYVALRSPSSRGASDPHCCFLGVRKQITGEQPFRRKQDVTNLRALLRNLNTVTSFLSSILLAPSEMEELDVV